MNLSKFFFLLIVIFNFQDAYASEKFTITTFNIRFFGLHADETRDPYIQTFLKDSVPASDIIVFEEIVDVPRIKAILPADWDCLSYENASPSHQHVVVCHSARFQFSREATDNNDVIDEVAGPEGKYRPAVTAIVSDKLGNQLFRIVGVHLKAEPAYSALRVEQSKIIAAYLEKLKGSNLPVIITGDFNTYKSPANKAESDDTDLILNAFNSTDLGIKRIPNDLYTFRSNTGLRGQFDQFYLSNSIQTLSPLHIFDICNAEVTTGTGTADLDYYYKNISDHCPVSAEITL